mgnify:CR=1 FL=1
MQYYTIPNDLGINAHLDKGLGLIQYSSKGDSIRHRVLFDSNLFSFVLRGEKLIHGESKPLLIDPNSFVAIKCGKCLMTEKAARGEYQSLLFFFSDTYLQKMAERYYPKGYLVQNPNNIVRFKHSNFSRHLRESLSLLSRQNSTNLPMLELKLEEIFLHLFQTQPQLLISLMKGKQNEAELKFKQVVENNLLLGLKLEELAFLTLTNIDKKQKAHQT